jgi:hypothetical protein
MRVHTSKLDFNAVPRTMNAGLSFLKKAMAGDVPDALGDSPTADEIKAMNAFLGKQRDLRKIELPDPMEDQGDVQGLVEAMADEIERLGKVTVDGAELDDTMAGFNFTVGADE